MFFNNSSDNNKDDVICFWVVLIILLLLVFMYISNSDKPGNETYFCKGRDFNNNFLGGVKTPWNGNDSNTSEIALGGGKSNVQNELPFKAFTSAFGGPMNQVEMLDHNVKLGELTRTNPEPLDYNRFSMSTPVPNNSVLPTREVIAALDETNSSFPDDCRYDYPAYTSNSLNEVVTDFSREECFYNGISPSLVPTKSTKPLPSTKNLVPAVLPPRPPSEITAETNPLKYFTPLNLSNQAVQEQLDNIKQYKYSVDIPRALIPDPNATISNIPINILKSTGKKN